MNSGAFGRIVVLGLGNLLYGDEGFGVCLAKRLYDHHSWPEQLEIVDGGTQGLGLLGYLEGTQHLLILDAVDFGLAAGEIVVKEDGHIPAYITAQKASVHQNSFSEVLAMASLKGMLPKKIVLMGMQPVSLEFGGKLSEQAQAALNVLEEKALALLAGWGMQALPPVPGKAHFQHPELGRM